MVLNFNGRVYYRAHAGADGLLSAADYAKLAGIAAPRGNVESYQSANIARASGTVYDFACDASVADTNGEWNAAGATFTAAHAGTYLVTAQVLIIAPPDQSRVYMQLTDTANVEFLRADDQTQSGAAADLRAETVALLTLAAGAQFKVRFSVIVPGGAAQTSRGGAAFMWLRIREVA